MPVLFGTIWWPIWMFPLCTAIGLSLVWLWRGRDDRAALPPKNSGRPPLELSPAQVATLVDNSCDLRDIVATLVDLAARGFVTIEETAPDELVLARGDLRFVRCSNGPPVERLKKHERMFLRALFDPQPPDIERGRRPANTNLSNESWNESALSLLQFKFYRHLPDLESEIYASLMREGFFFSDPKATRVFFASVGIGVLVIGLTLLRAVLGANEVAFTGGFVSVPIGILLSAVLWMFGARFMPAKTALGTLKSDEAHRFATWVRGVPISRVEAMMRHDAGVFERLLPYALVLGVGPTWAQKCGDCGGWAPFWFRSYAPTAQNAAGAIARLLEHLSHIERVFSSAPPPRIHSRDAHDGAEVGGF